MPGRSGLWPRRPPTARLWAEACENILAILPGHVEKKDSVLFPFAERRLTPAQTAAVNAAELHY